jgi:hypothetical protein
MCGQGDVGDGGVEHLHEGGQGDVMAISQGLTRGFHEAWLSAIFGFLIVFVPEDWDWLCPGESGIESPPVRTPAELPMHFPYSTW